MTEGGHRLPQAAPQRLWRLPTWLINQLSMRGSRLVVERLGAAGGRTRYAVLAVLEECGPLSQADLGRRLRIDRSDIVAVLNDLERDGFALRMPDPADRRRNAIHLTEAGRATLLRLDDEVEAAQEALFAALTAPERAQLLTLLQRLVVHHLSAGPQDRATDHG